MMKRGAAVRGPSFILAFTMAHPKVGLSLSRTMAAGGYMFTCVHAVCYSGRTTLPVRLSSVRQKYDLYSIGTV